MRVPKDSGLQRLHDLYQEELPTGFQLTLHVIEATELDPTDDGIVSLAVERYSLSLMKGGRTLVALELEDLSERSNVQELMERLEQVNGEYCFVGEVRKVETIHLAEGLAPSEMIEVSSSLARLLRNMSETVLIQEDMFLDLPQTVQSAWLRGYAFTEKSPPIRTVEHENVRLLRFDDPMGWSAW